MRIGLSTNEYGTTVSMHVCGVCGREFTVCPAATDDEWGDDCLDVTCGSYDVSRDIDRVWDGVNALVKVVEADAP